MNGPVPSPNAIHAAGYPPAGGPPGGGYGPPDGGYGGGGPVPAQPPMGGLPPGGGGAMPAAKKGSGGLIIGIIAVLLLVGGGGAAAWFLWLNASGPELAKYAPKDTQVYVEVPSLTKALVSFVGVDWIDEKELDSNAKKDELVGAFAKSFKIEEGEAESFLTGIKSVGVAFRKEDKKSDGAVMIGMSSAGAIEPLLASKRFKEKGDLGGGKKYKISRPESDKDDKDQKPALKFFNQLGEAEEEKDDDDKKKDDDDDDDKKKACVWFENAKLFACGEESFVLDIGKVINGDKESLAKGNESFAKAKWPGGSSLVAFIDPNTFDEDVKKDLFKDSGPVLVSLRFVDPGIMLTSTAELTGKKLPAEDLFEPAGDLTLFKKLPATTVAYMSMSTKTKLEGKEFRKQLVKMLDGADEKAAKEMEEGLDEMKEKLDFDLETIVDAVGDEMIIGVNATDKLTAEMAMKKDKDALDEVGFEMVIHLKDKEKAEKILKSVKGKVEDAAGDAVEISKKEGGFLFEPKMDGIPGVLAVIKDDKYLFIAGGVKKRITEMEAAFDGEATLGDDKAHAKAIGSLSQKAQMIIWADVGRAAKTALKEDNVKEMVKETLKEAGISLAAFVLEGDDRLTVVQTFGWSVKDGTWTVTSESLNGALLMPAAGAMFAMRSLASGGDDFKPRDLDSDGGLGGGGSAGDLPVVGVAECDDYIRKYSKCIDKMPPSARGAAKTGLENLAKGWKDGAAIPGVRSGLAESCKSAAEAMASNPMCK